MGFFNFSNEYKSPFLETIDNNLNFDLVLKNQIKKNNGEEKCEINKKESFTSIAENSNNENDFKVSASVVFISNLIETNTTTPINNEIDSNCNTSIIKLHTWRFVNNSPLLDYCNDELNCLTTAAVKCVSWQNFGFKLKLNMDAADEKNENFQSSSKWMLINNNEEISNNSTTTTKNVENTDFCELIIIVNIIGFSSSIKTKFIIIYCFLIILILFLYYYYYYYYYYYFYCYYFHCL
jgi:hypothetical protein